MLYPRSEIFCSDLKNQVDLYESICYNLKINDVEKKITIECV